MSRCILSRAAVWAVVALLALGAAGAGHATMPLPRGVQAELCPDTRREEGPHCSFWFGPGRRLEVPWAAREGPRWRRIHAPHRSDHGHLVREDTWPLGYCWPGDACLPDVGRPGRREAKPDRQASIFERWTLHGLLMPDGTVVHEAPSAAAARRAVAGAQVPDARPFTLILSTRTSFPSPEQRGRLSSRVTVGDHVVDLHGSCDTAGVVRRCTLRAWDRGLSLFVDWYGGNATHEAIFAAAADLFDRYVVEGPRLGR